MFALLLMAATGAWATDGIECSASDIGKVICTDGSIYAKVSDVPTGKTAAAMIAYIDTENNKGLALALSDEGSMTWSEANSACAGKSAVAGGTWVLPSKEQWEAMGAKESNSTSAIALRDGFSSVGGTNMQSGAYWSSTENSTNVNKAYRYYFTNGYYWENNVNKTVNNYVRACLTFNILVAPPTYSVTLAEGTEDFDKWTISPTEAAEGSPVTATYSGDRKVKSVKAVKKGATPAIDYSTAKLGDLFYSDGTFSTELEAGKTPIGVIAYLDKEGTDDDEISEKSNGAGHGLVLCLKNVASTIAWSTENVSKFSGQEVASVEDLKRTTNVSGYTNTATLTVDAATAEKYPAAYKALKNNGLTAPTGTTGWFLPSAQQLLKMIEGLGGLTDGAPNFYENWFDTNHNGADKLEAALSKAGSGNYDSMTSAYLIYWSSSECTDNKAVSLGVDATGTGFGYGFLWGADGKDNTYTMYRVRPVLAF